MINDYEATSSTTSERINNGTDNFTGDYSAGDAVSTLNELIETAYAIASRSGGENVSTARKDSNRQQRASSVRTLNRFSLNSRNSVRILPASCNRSYKSSAKSPPRRAARPELCIGAGSTSNLPSPARTKRPSSTNANAVKIRQRKLIRMLSKIRCQATLLRSYATNLSRSRRHTTASKLFVIRTRPTQTVPRQHRRAADHI